MNDSTMHHGRRAFLRHVARALGAGALVLQVPELLAAAAPKSAQILKLRQEQDKDVMRLVFDLSEEAAHTLSQLSNPDRLVVDFRQTALANGVSLALKDAPSVLKLRSAPRNEADFRIVLDLAQPAQARSYYVTENGKARQLVIELRSSGVPKAPAITLAQAKDAAPAAAPAKPKVEARAEAPAGEGSKVARKEESPQREVRREEPREAVAAEDRAAESERRPVKTARQGRGNLRDLVIAIDAGHGGKDPGAVGKNGTYEKDVVLKIARKLEALLEQESGYKPVLTRTSDVFLPLRERIRKARAHQADLFISIHADASPDRGATGSSVYVLSKNGASSEAARVLAERENAADLIGGVSLGDKDDLLASVLLDLSQRHTIESSHIVASRLIGELARLSDVHSDNVERAGFVVLKSPDIPSVLVETAFISNPREEERLRTDAFQNRIAQSLLSGIRKYFNEYAPEGTIVASERRPVNA